MQGVLYSDMVAWLESQNGQITIPTLGRRRTLKFWVDNGIIHGCDTHGNIRIYSTDYWNQICNVIDNLPVDRREKTTEYAHCSKFYQAPGVPALCRAYCEEHNE